MIVDKNANPNSITVESFEEKEPFLKRILIVDDDPDITLTFKVGLDDTAIIKQDLMYIHTIIPQQHYQNLNQIFTIYC